MRERNQTLFCVAYSSKTSSDALFRVRDIKLYSNESGLWARGFLHIGSSKNMCTCSFARMGSETFLLVFLFSLQKNPSSCLFQSPFLSTQNRPLPLSPTASTLRCSIGGNLKSVNDLNFLFSALHPLLLSFHPRSGATLPVITGDQRVCQRHLMVH